MKCTWGLALLLWAAISAHASITTYTNRSLWEAAAGGGTGDITDDFNSGTANRGSYIITNAPAIAFPNSNPVNAVDGTTYLRTLLSNSGTVYAILAFNSPIFALGYDINPQSTSLGATIQVTLDGSAAGSYNLPSTDTNGFFGFISTVPFANYKLTTIASSASQGIDNLEAYSVAAVPEPAVVALAGLALLLIYPRKTFPPAVGS